MEYIKVEITSDKKKSPENGRKEGTGRGIL